MLSFILKIENIFNSKKYRYFDMFLGFLFLAYCLYLFLLHNEIKYSFLILGIVSLIFGIFDLTRKIKLYIQRKMLGL